MFRRLRRQMDSGNQQVYHDSQQSGINQSSINDNQTLLIHSLMERILKQGDAIAEMSATLVGIKNSLDAFKSVIQKVETNISLSIPNLLTPIKNQVDQIPALKKDILELQDKVEILQTSFEQFKIEQYKRTNKTNSNCWLDRLFGFLQTRNNKKGKGIPSVLEKTDPNDTIQEDNTITMSRTELQAILFVMLLVGGIIGSLLFLSVR